MRADQVTGQLTVGQLATRTGVRTDTVRYYEREGLLPVPQRTEESTAGTGRPTWTGCCSSAARNGSCCDGTCC